jgi:hypothetical protein
VFVCIRRYEIMGVYEQMFDEEENLRMNCAAYERKGRLEGLAEGRRLQSEDVSRATTKSAASWMAPVTALWSVRGD